MSLILENLYFSLVILFNNYVLSFSLIFFTLKLVFGFEILAIPYFSLTNETRNPIEEKEINV